MHSTPSATVHLARAEVSIAAAVRDAREQGASLVLVLDDGQVLGLATVASLVHRARELPSARLSECVLAPIIDLPREATVAELDHALNDPVFDGVALRDGGELVALFTRLQSPPLSAPRAPSLGKRRRAPPTQRLV